MHEVERELRRLVRAGLPGSFVFIEDADRSSQFLTITQLLASTGEFTDRALKRSDEVTSAAMRLILSGES